jgi:hypothetical protein
MRLVWIILAALAFGGLVWFTASYGPMSGRSLQPRASSPATEPREPIIAPPGSLTATPRYAAPVLVIERSATDARGGGDLSDTAAFALAGWAQISAAAKANGGRCEFGLCNRRGGAMISFCPVFCGRPWATPKSRA